jgi:hypothetical protein
MAMTPEQIRQAGLKALRERLGRAGMIRFLQQFEPGDGDYARERRQWVDRMKLDDLQVLARGKPKRRKEGK